MVPETDPCILVFVTDTDFRDNLVDWLLNYAGHMVFSSGNVDYYGIDPASLDLNEQVSGHQCKLLFRIQTSLSDARIICQQLHNTFPGAKLHYWIQPVLEAGVLGGGGQD